MKIVSTIKEMQSLSEEMRLNGQRIGVVPTMGALHEGHLSLLTIAKQMSDTTIVTLFVNQKQFSAGEDFNKYPRNLERDFELVELHGGDIIFAPSPTEMYPNNFSSFVEVEHFGEILEGKIRPSHFRGVATVVTKLFNITKPHVAVFGQKDAQQAFIIEQMTHDLNFGIQIVIAPTIREADGLAMSSRNVYLTTSERVDATVLHHSLLHAEQMIFKGERNAQTIITKMKQLILEKPAVTSIDYVSIANAHSLEEIDRLFEGNKYLISLATRFGTTRLIDNTIIQL